MGDYIERSIFAYKIEGTITNREHGPRRELSFDHLKEIFEIIKEKVQREPKSIFYEQEGKGSLFMSWVDITPNELHGKFGWARKGGLPEKLDTRQWKTDILRLGTETYLFEPMHFIIYKYKDKFPILIQEFNFYAPRATRLCNYLMEIYKSTHPNSTIRIRARRLFTKDIWPLLEKYDVIKGIYIKAEMSKFRSATSTLFGSTTVADTLRFSRIFGGAKTFGISFYAGRGKEASLEISIEELYDKFEELRDNVLSFVITVSRGIGRSMKIDLKRHEIVLRKPIKYLKDEEGNPLRVTDTDDAIRVLKSCIDDIITQIAED